MAKPRVAIVRGEGPSVMVDEALRLSGAERYVNPEDRVMIKPNYVSAMSPSTGVTTDPRVVEAIITFLRGLHVKSIMVGEGGSGDTERAFDVVGIRDVVRRHGVKLVDLNRDERIEVDIPNALALHKIGVAKTTFQTTCIVNVPKLKVHHMALTTLGMKNLMGFILPKSIMHTQINEKIVDLASLIKPKINIVDGLIGSELDEAHGRPVSMKLIVAGKDIVAVDAVASAIMGIRPQDVRYLRLAEERGLGTSRLDQVDVVGERIEEVCRRFQLPPQFVGLKRWP
ncbi:MAG: DUF362 domain-containing protein [Candidatus Bathyarchaeia archaeon]